MPKSITKPEVKIAVDIKPVNPSEVAPAQKMAWQKFWQKLMAEVKAGER